MDIETKQYIDVETGLSRVMKNENLYKRLLAKFFGGDDFSKLEEAIAAGDMVKASEVAHAVKGVAANLSLDMLAQTASTLMNEFRDGIMDEKSIGEYRDALEKTISYVNSYTG